MSKFRIAAYLGCLIVLVCMSFLVWANYRIYQTVQGICHSEGRVLSQQELEQRFYQNVLLDYRHTDLYFNGFKHVTNRAYHQLWAKYGFHGAPAGHITLTQGKFSLPHIKEVVMARALQEPNWRAINAKTPIQWPKEKKTKEVWQQQAKAYQQWRIEFAIQENDLDINARTQTITPESLQRYINAIQQKQAIVFYRVVAGDSCVQALTFIPLAAIQKASPTLAITWWDKMMGYGKHQRRIDVYNRIPIGCPFRPEWNSGFDALLIAQMAKFAIPELEAMIKHPHKYRDMVSVSTCGVIKDEHKSSSLID